ncbi:hypothetical protein [Flavobacterium sp. IB48]|uniref:hypothetical protein n=1 Tax=Flavobacterium sp. IB48 TaxID=2779375 RepID=UPI0018E6F753|nr:hypothetical protein [Flavobacterium sp. IB48]MBJ2126429.1 hypothetical protein [Flavobacterium sp. IB48]
MHTIDKSKIAILTTVANFELYKRTATIFPEEIDKIVIDGTNGMYGLESINYMFKKLNSKKYEWIIMADEDIFFYDSNLVFDLITYMDKNDYQISGVRDGGLIKHRINNPEVINTFFSVINFKKLSEIYDFKLVKEHQIFIPEIFENKDYSFLKYDYDIKSLDEPYYCFYFWAILKGFKILYLDTINPVNNDKTGNIVLDVNGNKIAFHSWYARAYKVHEKQTKRIDHYIKEFKIEEASINLKDVQIFKRRFFNFKKRLKKSIKKYIGK